MKIQLLSDLHIECAPYKFRVEPSVDVLVLAGDISHFGKMEKILTALAGAHPSLQIVYILGNHEFYGETLSEVTVAAKALRIPNVHILVNSTVEIGGVVFIGSTLWSDIDMKVEAEVTAYMNDYRVIYASEDRLVTPTDTVAEFKRNCAFLAEQLEANAGKRVVVVTHHLPTFKSIHPRYAGCSVNCCFASNLDEMILQFKPSLWLHGHTHVTMDYKLGDTRIVCNPRGYPRGSKTENEEFSHQLVLSLDVASSSASS
jgi:Icc-related predicted phosphoesterase